MTCDFTCTSWLTGTTLNTVQITVNINIIFELWRLQLMLGAGNCSFIYPSIFLSFPDWLKSNNNDWCCLALIVQWEKERFFGKIASERHERWICASCRKRFRYCVNIFRVKTNIYVKINNPIKITSILTSFQNIGIFCFYKLRIFYRQFNICELLWQVEKFLLCHLYFFSRDNIVNRWMLFRCIN